MTYIMCEEFNLFSKEKEIKINAKLLLDEWNINISKQKLENLELTDIPLAKSINTNISTKPIDKSLF